MRSCSRRFPRSCWNWRSSLVLLTTLVATNTAAAGGGLVPDCPPNGPVFRTLDSIAGGIDTALDQALRLGRGLRRGIVARPPRGCDQLLCDDACDAVTLRQLTADDDEIQLPRWDNPDGNRQKLTDPSLGLPVVPRDDAPPQPEMLPRTDDGQRLHPPTDPFSDDPQSSYWRSGRGRQSSAGRRAAR